MTLVGIADYLNNPANHSVVIKLETNTATDFFIGFNRAVGVNSQNDEADDEVTIITTGNNGEGYSQSYLQAHLVQGESYTINSFAGSGRKIVIEAVNIDITTDPGTAEIKIWSDLSPTASPSTSPPTISPTSAAPTLPPTAIASCLAAPGKTTMNVAILTDSYPRETSWTLVNECTSETVATGSGYTQSATTYSSDVCVDANAQYTFTINDCYGDGELFNFSSVGNWLVFCKVR